MFYIYSHSFIKSKVKMLKLSMQIPITNIFKGNIRCFATAIENRNMQTAIKFETVFSLPFIKYISLLNRLKVYQMVGTSLVVPGCGIMEMLNYLPHHSFLSASYIGLTGTALLSLASLPFRNTIGFLYISDDNKFIKISSMDFWGRRKDKIVAVDDWMPLLDMKHKRMDAVYLTPQLTDGTKYKWFVKFGIVSNASKIGQVLD